MPPFDIGHDRPRARPRRKRSSGFSLLELVVVLVVVGVLAAIAVPRYVALGTQARIAAIKAGVGAVSGAISLAHMRCKLTPGCDDNSNSSAFVTGPGGVANGMYYGYPTGLSRPGGYYGIRDWVQMDGFTVTEGYAETVFQLIGAPDPVNCKVVYDEAQSSSLPAVSSATSGC